MLPSSTMLTTGKRILIFSLAYVPVVGGAELAVKEITDRISNIEFDLVTLRFSKDHLKQEKIGNVHVYRIGGGLGYLSKVLFPLRAALWAKRRRYDAYWGIMTYMLFPIALLRLLGNRTPYILTLQDGDPFERVFGRARIFPFLPLLFYGFRHASHVQAISNYLAQWAREMGYKGNLSLVPNGVDVEKFAEPTSPALGQEGKSREKSVRLITTSRLVKKNGVGDIIESLKYLPEHYTLQILGIGPLEPELKSKVESLKLGSRVEFLGHKSLDEIPHYLHNADVFVRPSLSEGFGTSFIEAMASGLPVVTTPVGGIPDFLKDGSTGVFCKPHNPESIAQAVERLEDASLRQQIVTNALEMVREKYDWRLIAEEMESKVLSIV